MGNLFAFQSQEKAGLPDHRRSRTQLDREPWGLGVQMMPGLPFLISASLGLSAFCSTLQPRLFQVWGIWLLAVSFASAKGLAYTKLSSSQILRGKTQPLPGLISCSQGVGTGSLVRAIRIRAWRWGLERKASQEKEG